jgi:ABC-type multidrug transport system fused ATPase/permease subunit
MDTPLDVTDPADLLEGGRSLPPGPLGVTFRGVAYAYPGGPPVLTGINLTIAPRARIAIVGETGSGKTTLAKLLTRLMDPTSGSVELSGISLREVGFADLRGRVVMVPQEGHLFEASIADNVRYGRLDATDEEVFATFAELGLSDWLAGLPRGVHTPVGQRGELLSAGERQLVAIARAHLADPDLLVMDEATSAVDPATERRLAVALESLASGRTTVTIAHRLKAAEEADEIVVVDAGRIVQRGAHPELVAAPGVYARLHASWAAGSQQHE